MQPLPEPACPLCGAPNHCRAAESGSFDSRCWCTEVTIDPVALDRVPEPARNRACLCRRCAIGEHAATAPR